GMEVLVRYLERGSRPVTCLVRAESDAAARARLDRILDELIANGAELFEHRVEAVAGELTAPDLGLSPGTRERLATEVKTIVHCAASVSFELPLEEARKINVGGTRRMLDFAKLAQARGGLDRYAQVSTAYVAGTHTGSFSEDDLDVGQGFRNTYEQSKFESEQLVRADGCELPWIVLRPSIVVGDRSSGWTAAFNVMYWPLRALSTGLFKAVPAMPESPLDIVSIDYVADAIYELSTGHSGSQQTFHLTAGSDASTFQEIVSLSSRYFRRPEPRAVPPEEFQVDPTTLSEVAVEASRIYFPYFSISTVFENARTRTRLAQAGIHATPLREYLFRLLDFATRSRWGKRPIGRAAAQAQ
ncbi:MAG: SDR family oxidoreductase, partial [Conexibacteraceae bacterium]|nr:SDR family oxidoreductase [Conexibacteraceae bacterium]